ncbi:MAG TPA: MMPL family transporter, partial [Desulfobacteraceae bacterium]|nr:MMPL family transporter [Desulfobacteraceae bacterium]
MNLPVPLFLKTAPIKRTAIILGCVLIYLACLAWTADLHLDEKITAMLPDSNEQAADFKAIMENVPALETLYIDVENRHARDRNQFYTAADLVFEQLKDSPLFLDITYRFSSGDFFDLMAMLDKKRGVLLTEEDDNALQARLTKEEIHRRLVEVKRELLNPAGLFMVERARKDPFDFNAPLAEKLNSLKNERAGITIQEGRITSRDNNHILILATPAFSAVDTEKSKEMIAFLHQVGQTIEKRFNGNITTGFSGNHIATHDNATAIKGDVKRAVSILGAAIACMGLLFFRRRVFILLVFLPTVFSLTAAAALVASVYPSVSAISLGCGAVLVGITVDFGIHILFSLDNSPHKGPARIVHELRRPIAAGAFTTMAAFTCLLFSSLPGQRQMGLFSLAGVLFAALFACFLLKYFIPGPGRHPRAPVVPLTALCGRLIGFRQRHTPLLMVLCLVLFVTGLYGLPLFAFDGDIASLNHLSPRVREDTDTFLETWGKSSPAVVLVKGRTLDRALHRNDILYRQLTALEKQGMVGEIASLAPVLPSPEVQAENRRQWEAFMSEKNKKRIERIVAGALPELGFSQEAFAPFFSSLDTTPHGIFREDFQDTPLEKVMNEKIIVEKDHTLVMTTFHIEKRSEVPAIEKAVKTRLPGARFLDKKSFIAGSARVVAHEFKKLLVFAAMGMVVSVMLFIRPVKAAVVTMVPVVSSIIVTAGLLGLMAIPVNLIT